MSPVALGLIGVCALFILIFLRVPVGISMALVGFIGVGLIRGMEPGLITLAKVYFEVGSNYVFSVVPLFVAMGFLASVAGLSEDAFYAINKWMGHLRGGLAMATTGACAVFAAICGDPLATATTVGSVSLPEMRKHKYADVLSLGCLAAGGNLGYLIPPSIGFIFYAILSEQSIGTLFIAGILPGILLTSLFMVTIWVWCLINPRLALTSPKAGWGERLGSLRYIFGSVILILLVLGGIYAGIFTPTEAGAVGVFGIVVIGLAKKRINWQNFSFSLVETAKLVGRLFVLITGAVTFSRFISVTGIPTHLADLLISLDVSIYIVLVAVLVFYIIVGFFMDIMSIILLTVPIFHPILAGLGLDGVWVAVLVMITILMGHISPPVGLVVYGLHAYASDVPLFTIFRGTIPFLGAMAVCLVILFLFPQISLFLPYLMRPG